MTRFQWILLASGVCWTITYLLIIRAGSRDRTYAMPLAALAANLSWEFIFFFVLPHGYPQRAVNLIWLGFDVIIASQLLRFGPSEWKIPRSLFTAVFGISLATAYFGVLLVTLDLYDLDRGSGAYAAFGQNLMMSVLFVEFFRTRPDLRGQRLSIAMWKLAGTAFASLGFWLDTQLGKTSLMMYLFLAILGFDALYACLIWHRERSLRKAVISTS